MEVNDHFLQPYFDLLENDYLLDLTNDFFHIEGMKYQYFVDYGDMVFVSWEEKTSSYLIEINSRTDFQTIELTLSKYISNHLEFYYKGIIKKIRGYIYGNPKSVLADYFDALTKELKVLYEKASKYKNKEISEVILTSLNQLMNFINERATKEDSVKEDSFAKVNKLKWLGNINTLATLFYDLSNEKNNLKKQLIEYDRISLTDFIVENFLDKEGQPISRHTIYTVLDANRPEKRAKKDRYLIQEDFAQEIPAEEAIVVKNY